MFERIRELAVIDAGDDPSEIRAHTIREDEGYPGVRVRLVATLGKTRMTIGVDVNFGDPIWPEPAEIALPRLIQIGLRPVRLLGVPLPMVIAEKIVTALQRGEANTRWRDFADVLMISRTHELAADELRAAFEAVATFREITLRPMLPGLDPMQEVAAAKWSNWRRRQSQARDLPDRFEAVLRAVAAFVDPVLDATAPTLSRWNSVERAWMQGAP